MLNFPLLVRRKDLRKVVLLMKVGMVRESPEVMWINGERLDSYASTIDVTLPLFTRHIFYGFRKLHVAFEAVQQAH